ncbi:RNA polymerase sigma factor [Sandaracinus amylolyticus]|uniref:RNA polymerase sigma factor n=1 Tax=Sandaracinus amylolyticus TaxID=927083 RepID=UPI001F1B01EB|nr:sigma-70 family RNA polymerase sigma factor [Sandaracinus amylolyticus]UJR82667.1 Hypothetical protein I5071_47320 [Sandaracinus amylolyticus]
MDPVIDSLVRTHRRALVAIARREGLGPEEALECVQDALCTFLSLPHPPHDHALAAICVMVRNAARNVRRRHHRLRIHDPIADELAAPCADAESLVSRAEDVARLRSCVAALRGPQREVVLLRLLEERSGEDVASELGLARGHVDVLVHRAKRSLRECMSR